MDTCCVHSGVRCGWKAAFRDWRIAGVAILLSSLGVIWGEPAPAVVAEGSLEKVRVPLLFERAIGEGQAAAEFRGRAPGFWASLSAERAVLTWWPRDGGGSLLQGETPASPAVVYWRWLGANGEAAGTAEAELPTRMNFFTGGDASEWRAGVPAYGRVRFAALYPLVDLVYYGNDRELEYDLVVAPGGDPGCIRFTVEGADDVWVEASGDLVLRVGAGEIRQRRPRVFQDTPEGRVSVRGDYVVEPGSTPVVRFELGTYDPAVCLVIDPVVVGGTYYGGTLIDICRRVTVAADGSVVVVGETASADIPLVNAWQPASGGGPGYPKNAYGCEAFVAKIDRSGTNLLFATYLGGVQIDAALTVKLDAANGIWVAGLTHSPDFPVTTNAWSTKIHGNAYYGIYELDGFVSHLSADGSQLLYSTFLGGKLEETITDLVVAPDQTIWVTGATKSSDFPLVGSSNAFVEDWDVFVAHLSGAGSELLFSALLGGSGDDIPQSLCLNALGGAWVGGYSSSGDLPKSNAWQSAFGGGVDGFVAQVRADGVWDPVTHLGGSLYDEIRGMEMLPGGDLCVLGVTASKDFATNHLVGVTNAANLDVFVARYAPGSTRPAYLTRVGGSGLDHGWGLSVSASGEATVAGHTTSTNFPVLQAIQSTNSGGTNGFAFRLSADGSNLVFSSYLTRGRNDEVYSLGAAPDGTYWICGRTASTNTFSGFGVTGLPATNAFGKVEGFLLRWSPENPDLQIQAEAGEGIVLSWPRALSGYTLETLPSLSGSTTNWLPWPDPPATAEGRFRVTVTDSSRPSEYYRLRGPE